MGKSSGLRVLPIRWLLIGVISLALTVRLAAISYAKGYRQPWPTEYEIIAKTLVEEGYFGFNFYGTTPNQPSSFMPPFYPFVLAGMMSVFPNNTLLATRLLQALVSAISCLLVYKIGKWLFSREEVGLLAALGAAIYPPFIGGVVGINTVTFDTFFLALATYFLLRRESTPKGKNETWAGCSLGLAALTRVTALAILPTTFVWLSLRAQNHIWREAVKPFVSLLLAISLIILPWTLRNYLVHRELILISTNGGLNFWIGNNEKATGEYIFPSALDSDLFTQSASLSEVQRDRLYYKTAVNFIREHPWKYMELLAQKTLYFWLFRPNIGANYPNAGEALDMAKSLYILSFVLLLPGGVLGIILSLSQWRKLFLIYGLLASQMATHILYFSGTRFRTPVDPYLIIFASFTIVVALDWIRTSLRKIDHGYVQVARDKS